MNNNNNGILFNDGGYRGLAEQRLMRHKECPDNCDKFKITAVDGHLRKWIIVPPSSMHTFLTNERTVERLTNFIIIDKRGNDSLNTLRLKDYSIQCDFKVKSRSQGVQEIR
jgi:hypothetical protein